MRKSGQICVCIQVCFDCGANITNINSPINVLLPIGLTNLSYWSGTEAKCVSHVVDYSAKIYVNSKISR